MYANRRYMHIVNFNEKNFCDSNIPRISFAIKLVKEKEKKKIQIVIITFISMYDTSSDSASFVQRNSAHRNLNIHTDCIERHPTCQLYNNHYYTQMERVYNCKTITRQLSNMEAITTGFYKFLARFSGEYTMNGVINFIDFKLVLLSCIIYHWKCLI